MRPDIERYILDVMSGTRRGVTAGSLRLALSALEPFYASTLLARNAFYRAGLKSTVMLDRPVISIGNLTTGGTGKTPMVRWLAGQLRAGGKQVAVLSRGYKSAPGQPGDEQIMLDHLLNGPGVDRVILRANPDRVVAAQEVLRETPQTDLFLLDDGFQHRRVARNLDIVLLSAVNPFGYGHVLPRGLLREPISGLRRAGAVVITHADQVNESAIMDIERRIRRSHGEAAIYRAVHRQTGLRTASAPAFLAPDRAIEDLKHRKFFAFSGIGNPHVLHTQLQALGSSYVGNRWFADHHLYTENDCIALRQAAARHGAELLVTTEKDWVKINPLASTIHGYEIWRMDIEMCFLDHGEERLLRQVHAALKRDI